MLAVILMAALPAVAKAPDHLVHLDSMCASLNDAIRTAAARGLQGTVMADLQVERARAVRERTQCHELQRILHAKRQRLAGMTPGETADFERSEANDHGRCSAR
jgi:hypothetical protein